MPVDLVAQTVGPWDANGHPLFNVSGPAVASSSQWSSSIQLEQMSTAGCAAASASCLVVAAAWAASC